ncbi:hypothetical protein DL96DRAFT_1559411 [Flagelloscypha sp. PMI_526]|nr:hypothetical protein DL96DRAFT_1559411 [Flagelloscypha sp. PMI_526]
MSTPYVRKKRTHTKSKDGCKTCKIFDHLYIIPHILALCFIGSATKQTRQPSFPNCENCKKRRIECDWPQVYIDQQGLSMYDLELIHHFTTTTAVSLLDIHGIESPQVLGIYQRNAPRLALAHPFLMHSLLAVSALHLHWLNRKGSASTAGLYYALSCYHRTHAARTYDASQCPQTHCIPHCACGGLSDAQFLTNLILSLHAICDTMLGIPDYVHPEVRTMHWFANGLKGLGQAI